MPLPPRWALFSLAALVIILDIWSKQWAVDKLANAVHPMVIAQSDSIEKTLLSAGLSAAEIATAQAQGSIGHYVRSTGLRADKAVEAQDLQMDFLATADTGLVPPRRMRLSASDLGKPLGEAIGRAWRIDAENVQNTLDKSTWHSNGRVLDVKGPVPAGEIVALRDRSIALFDGFSFVYAENFGAAWSFLSDAPPLVRQLIFVGISLIASLGMAFVLLTGRMQTRWSAWALAAIMGGAVGNLIDRVRFHAVVDFVYNFITIDGKVHGWPVYNVADIGITCGVIAIALEMLLQKQQPAAQAKLKDAAVQAKEA